MSIKPCAVILLTPTELQNLPRPRRRELESPELDIWSLSKILTDEEWRLFYRIVELGGQVALLTEPVPLDSQNSQEQMGPRLRIVPSLLPVALNKLHVAETMNPVPNEGTKK
jgi:hypothetical protein